MDATPGFEQFASAFGRQHLVLGEADHQCPETGAVLHGSLNLIGEGSLLEVSATTAGLPAPMPGDLQDGRRKAGHLAGMTVARLKLSPAGFAVLRAKVIHQEIGRFRTGKCEAGMSGNAADRTLTRLAQRTRFAQTIRSGRLRGVRAVLRQLSAQRSVLRFKPLDRGPQFGKLFAQLSEALPEKADELIFVGVAQAAEFR